MLSVLDPVGFEDELPTEAVLDVRSALLNSQDAGEVMGMIRSIYADGWRQAA